MDGVINYLYNNLFQCKTCNARFSTKDHLTQHEKSHTAESQQSDNIKQDVTSTENEDKYLGLNMGDKMKKVLLSQGKVQKREKDLEDSKMFGMKTETDKHRGEESDTWEGTYTAIASVKYEKDCSNIEGETLTNEENKKRNTKVNSDAKRILIQDDLEDFFRKIHEQIFGRNSEENIDMTLDSTEDSVKGERVKFVSQATEQMEAHASGSAHQDNQTDSENDIFSEHGNISRLKNLTEVGEATEHVGKVEGSESSNPKEADERFFIKTYEAENEIKEFLKQGCLKIHASGGTQSDLEEFYIKVKERLYDCPAELDDNNKQDKPYKCDQCHLSFVQKYKLDRHYRVHTGEKPYKCNICGAAFSQKGVLVNHGRLHTGEKPFKCEICDATFSVKGYLIKHHRTHTGEKPFKCTLCDSVFSDRGNLSKHKKIHTGEKPYKCDTCNAAFSDRSTLVKHHRIHTDVKKYKCEFCNASFAMKSALTTHTKVHTAVIRHKCDICDAEFSQRGYLIRHLRTHTTERQYIPSFLMAKKHDTDSH